MKHNYDEIIEASDLKTRYDMFSKTRDKGTLIVTLIETEKTDEVLQNFTITTGAPTELHIPNIGIWHSIADNEAAAVVCRSIMDLLIAGYKPELSMCKILRFNDHAVAIQHIEPPEDEIIYELFDVSDDDGNIHKPLMFRAFLDEKEMEAIEEEEKTNEA